MASAGSSRKEPSATPTPSKPKKQSSKVNDSVASSARSSPVTTAPPSANGDANASSKPASAQKPSAAANTDASQQGEIETQQCKHCKKYVPKEGFSNHSKQCLRDKKERKRQKEAQAAAAQAAIDNAASGEKEKDAEGDTTMADSATGEILAAATDKNGESTPVATKNAKKSAVLGETSSNTKNSKKRKADDTPTAQNAQNTESASKPPPKKQKKKEENKPKAAKPKGPVDVEKQCGVPLPNGAMCARSLTCKSHSMGAKRAVPGRSLPYDALLHQYQKKNQAKQQKAALASTAPLADDSQLQSGPVDSDEEREAVMAGLARAAPQPLYDEPIFSARQRYNHVRMKEMLSNALGGNRGSGLFASAPHRGSVVEDPASATSAGGANASNEWDGSRRMSSVQA